MPFVCWKEHFTALVSHAKHYAESHGCMYRQLQTTELIMNVLLFVSRILSLPREHAEDVAVVCEALRARDAAQVVAVSQEGHQDCTTVSKLLRTLQRTASEISKGGP